MFQIGSWAIKQPLVLAPMAGITDAPFRRLCHRFGAGMTVAEMLSCDKRLWHTRKSQQRLQTYQRGDDTPHVVQLAGNDPKRLAEAARLNQDLGADIIDINMGCPAKKVCKKAAGSALLRDEALVNRILTHVVQAVDIPVTVKIRTGWSKDHRNAVNIAKMAERAGIQALAIHGRTRACAFKGEAEYDTIAEVCAATTIPVIANGDIQCAQKAKQVLAHTQASAVMLGRAAWGNPWIFREINHFLTTGQHLAKPSLKEVKQVLLEHLRDLYQWYGETQGVRIARKHTSWYIKEHITPIAGTLATTFRETFNRIEGASEQGDAIYHFFNQLKNHPLKEDIAA